MVHTLTVEEENLLFRLARRLNTKALKQLVPRPLRDENGDLVSLILEDPEKLWRQVDEFLRKENIHILMRSDGLVRNILYRLFEGRRRFPADLLEQLEAEKNDLDHEMGDDGEEEEEDVENYGDNVEEDDDSEPEHHDNEPEDVDMDIGSQDAYSDNEASVSDSNESEDVSEGEIDGLAIQMNSKGLTKEGNTSAPNQPKKTPRRNTKSKSKPKPTVNGSAKNIPVPPPQTSTARDPSVRLGQMKHLLKNTDQSSIPKKDLDAVAAYLQLLRSQTGWMQKSWVSEYRDVMVLYATMAKKPTTGEAQNCIVSQGNGGGNKSKALRPSPSGVPCQNGAVPLPKPRNLSPAGTRQAATARIAKPRPTDRQRGDTGIIFVPKALDHIPDGKDEDPWAYTLMYRQYQENQHKKSQKAKQKVHDTLSKTDHRLCRSHKDIPFPKNFKGPVNVHGMSMDMEDTRRQLRECEIACEGIARAMRRSPRPLLKNMMAQIAAGHRGHNPDAQLVFRENETWEESNGEKILELLQPAELTMLEYIYQPDGFTTAVPDDACTYLLRHRVERMLGDKSSISIFADDKWKPFDDFLVALNLYGDGEGRRRMFTAEEVAPQLEALVESGYINVDRVAEPALMVRRNIGRDPPERRICWTGNAGDQTPGTALPRLETEAKSPGAHDIQKTRNFFMCLAFRLGLSVSTYEAQVVKDRETLARRRGHSLLSLEKLLQIWEKETQEMTREDMHGAQVVPGIDSLLDIIEAVEPDKVKQIWLDDPASQSTLMEMKDHVRKALIREASEDKRLIPSAVHREGKIPMRHREAVWSWAHPSKKAPINQRWDLNNWCPDKFKSQVNGQQAAHNTGAPPVRQATANSKAFQGQGTAKERQTASVTTTQAVDTKATQDAMSRIFNDTDRPRIRRRPRDMPQQNQLASLMGPPMDQSQDAASSLGDWIDADKLDNFIEGFTAQPISYRDYPIREVKSIHPARSCFVGDTPRKRKALMDNFKRRFESAPAEPTFLDRVKTYVWGKKRKRPHEMVENLQLPTSDFVIRSVPRPQGEEPPGKRPRIEGNDGEQVDENVRRPLSDTTLNPVREDGNVRRKPRMMQPQTGQTPNRLSGLRLHALQGQDSMMSGALQRVAGQGEHTSPQVSSPHQIQLSRAVLQRYLPDGDNHSWVEECMDWLGQDRWWKVPLKLERLSPTRAEDAMSCDSCKITVELAAK